MIDRYDRQIKSAAFGQEAQHKLSTSTFLIIGAGALGSTICEMLARSGAAHLVVCDMDVVSMSNLHRQSLYDEADCKSYRLKVDALSYHIQRINRNVKVTTISEEINQHNIKHIIEQYKPIMLIDGTDNFLTRYIINDACNIYNLPWVYGACLNTSGTVYGIEGSPCLRCILPEEPTTGQDCSLSGILPQTAHIAASLQIAEIMHYIKYGHFTGKLTTFDCNKMNFKSVNIDALCNTSCPTCARKLYPTLTQTLSVITKMCHGKYQTSIDSHLFHAINKHIVHQNEHFKLLSYKNHRIHLLSNGRIIIFDVTSKDEAMNMITSLIKDTTKKA
ncbi:HesA/MoeB/ThiF family protein [Macrococcoides goetzii]|nr:HesA/MoeB/ThiF family protein [Macrococcus goetzii]TDM49429.1 HesA/MoeB/ThiF family protein [Macrococcus goetzii]